MKQFALLVCLGAMAFAQEEAPDKRLRHSAETFKEIMATPDKGIPRGLLDHSQCIVIIPGMKKAAFVVGGEYGRGFASCRAGATWTGPAAVRMGGGSFGLQLGADSTDVVLLVMNRRGLSHMLSDKFTIGGDATAAVGPVGRDAKADTDVLMNAEILSWSRSKGLFAGVSLNGTWVQSDKSENEKLYGKPTHHRDILSGEVQAPAGADILTAELAQYSSKGSSADRQNR